MKLKKIRHQPTPAYPTFAEYQVHREGYLHRLALGTGALLAVGIAGSCDDATRRTAGVPPPPASVVERPVPRLLGEPVAPQKPTPKTPDGAQPTPAVAPLVVLGGIVRAPAPPPKAEPVTAPGGIKAPKPEPTPPPPMVMGKIKAPEPIPPPPRPMGTPPVVPPPPRPAAAK